MPSYRLLKDSFDSRLVAVKSFLGEPRRRFLRATLLLAVFMLLAVAVLPKDPVSLWSDYSWRQTRTFAIYQCLEEGADTVERIGCLFAQPLGFDEKRYVGQEFPLFQLVDHLLFPGQTVERVYTLLPLLSAAVLLGALGAVLFLRERPLPFLLLTAALWYAAIVSPVFDYFQRSYQPDLFSLALLAAGGFYSCHFRMIRLGVVLIALGVLAKPQHLALGLAMLAFFPPPPESFRRYAKRLLLLSFFTVLPLALYFLSIVLHHRWGFPINPMRNPGIWFRTDVQFRFILDGLYPHLLRVDLPFLFAGTLALAYILERIRRPLGWQGVLAPSLMLAAAAVIYWVLFYYFLNNTYYSVIFLGAMMLSIVLFTSLTPEAAAGRRLSLIVPLAVILALVLPHTWEEKAVLMKSRSESCRPQGWGEMLETLKKESPVYLNCQWNNATCRASLGYHGINLGWRELAKPEVLR